MWGHLDSAVHDRDQWLMLTSASSSKIMNSSFSCHTQAFLQLPTRPWLVWDTTTLYITGSRNTKGSNSIYLISKATTPIICNSFDLLSLCSSSTIHPDLHCYLPAWIALLEAVVTSLQGSEESEQGVWSVPGKDHNSKGADGGDH